MALACIWNTGRVEIPFVRLSGCSRVGDIGGTAPRGIRGTCGVSGLRYLPAVQSPLPDASIQAHLQARRDAEATPEPAAGPAGDFELEA